jgi:hypothetical protein
MRWIPITFNIKIQKYKLYNIMVKLTIKNDHSVCSDQINPKTSSPRRDKHYAGSERV